MSYSKYIKRYWPYFIIGPICRILAAIGEFIVPYLSALMINNGAAKNDTDYILYISLIMVGVIILMIIFDILGMYLAIKAGTSLATDLRLDTYKRIQEYSFSNIDEISVGSLITRCTNDIAQVEKFTTSVLRGVFRAPIMIIGAVIMSFVLDPSVAVIFLIVIPVLIVVIYLIIYIANPRYTRMQQKIDSLNSNIKETTNNQRVIKSFVRENYMIEKFEEDNEELRKKSISALKMMILMQPVIALAVNVSTVIFVYISGKNVIYGNLEIGTLTAFITYLTQILQALNFLANIVLQGTRAHASSKRIREVFNEEIDIIDREGIDKSLKIEDGSIEFKNVSFKYFKNDDSNILDNINIKIESGQTIGILGSTGSGKTSLVSLIPRLYDPIDGDIIVGNHNVKDISLFNLREDISTVLQKNTLFSGTIKENLMWGNSNATDEEIEKALKISAAYKFVNSFKNGLDTLVVEGGNNLSGGQKQRLCIARALLKKPKILILDDSTSACDLDTEREIRSNLDNYLKDTTKLIIAQKIVSVSSADKIIILDNGSVVGVGKHDELLKNNKYYQEIYYSQRERGE